MAAPCTHVSKLGKLVCEFSSFTNEKSRHRKVVEEHYFNYAVSLVLPGCDRVPAIITSHLCAEKAYFIPDLPVTRLIDKEFIEAFVKKGDVSVISHGTRIDSEDCVALLPSGHLLLHVTKDTYEQLGLEGKPSKYGGKKQGKFVIEIDLTQSCFTPVKKNYQRTKRCLEENFPLCLKFLVMWTPKDSSVCSSSMALYFEKKGFDYKQLNMKQIWKTHKNIEVPVIDSCRTETQEECCGVTDLYEWLGYISSNCNIPGGSEEYLSSYTCPAPASSYEKCICYRIEGMLSNSTILTVLQCIRDHIKSSSIPWAAVTAHGFADSPVSWQRREHGFQASGENLFTFVVFQNDDYWLFSAVDSADVCP